MVRILKFLNALAILSFLCTLLYVYALLPDQVEGYHQLFGKGNLILTKEQIFYGFLTLFIVSNGAIKVYKNLKAQTMNIRQEDYMALSKQEQVFHWLTGLLFGINLTIIFSLLFFGMYHNAEHFNISHYVALLYIGPIVTVGWFFWLIYLLFFYDHKQSANQ